MKRLKINSGLTIIELLLVLGIFSIIGLGLGGGAFSLLFQSYFTNTVERMARTLHTAQIYSLSGRDDSVRPGWPRRVADKLFDAVANRSRRWQYFCERFWGPVVGIEEVDLVMRALKGKPSEVESEPSPGGTDA